MKLDEVDGMMTLPPEDDVKIVEQIEFMRGHLNRPPLTGMEITMPLLRWQWSWLHMRYHNIITSFRSEGKKIPCKSGLRIKEFFKERELKFKEAYNEG
jgi:hypothetical protein